MGSSEHRRPWDRRKGDGESSKAHAAFVRYAELGPERRSIDLAWREHQKSTGKASPDPRARAHGTWRKWSQRFAWVARAEAYDAHMLEAAVAARKDQVQRAMQRIYDRAHELVDRHIEEGVAEVPKLVEGKPETDSFAMKEQRQDREFLLAVVGISPKVKVEASGPGGAPLVPTTDPRAALRDLVSDPDAVAALRALAERRASSG